MFKTRLISGIFLIIAALLLICTGGDVLLAGLLVISMIGLHELYRVLKIEKSLYQWFGYLAVVLFYLNLRFAAVADNMLFVLVCLIIGLAIYVLSFPKYHAQDVMGAFFGIFYVAVMLSYVYQTRMLERGAVLVWLIFICSWGCDTCAYCTGMLIGKHKMAPVLSPKKTVEGAVGGVVGAALIAIIYGMVMRQFTSITVKEVLFYALICAVGGLISMIGDLAASAIKRNFEIKDYGTLIPGHGGILDRFDSVIFTAPIIYYLAVYLIP